MTYDEPLHPPTPIASSSSTGVNPKAEVDQIDDADLEDGEISDSPDTPFVPSPVETNVASVMAPVLAHSSLPAKPTVRA